MSIPLQRIRLAIQTSDKSAFVDKLTANNAFLWRGTDVRFELAAFYKDTLLDFSNVTSLTLEVKPLATPTTTAVMSKTVAVFNNALTLPQWDDDSSQHCVVTFANTETAPAITGTETNFWLVVSVILTGGEIVTLGVSTLTIKEDGTGVITTPPLGDPTYPTLVQADARYIAKAPVGANVRFKDGEGMQYYDPIAPGWRTLLVTDGAIGWGPAEA